MISKFEISSASGAAGYFDSAFSKDNSVSADNYYLSEQAQARWGGSGSKILGLEDQTVEKEDFVSLLEGKVRNPASGEMQDLGSNSVGDRRRMGIDFTISPPKSVSIVGLVGNDERVMAAHQEANGAAMEWLEKHGAVFRVKGDDGENVFVQGSNLIWASVSHEVSRANEPQIHNHNVVQSIVYDDGSKKWRSLTNDALYSLRSDADVIYKSALASNLERAGYELDYKKDGVDFEIKGVNEKQIEAFSTRSAQIAELLKERGVNPSDATFGERQTAALDSRARKEELPRELLQSKWEEIAISSGLNLSDLVDKAKQRGPLQQPDKVQIAQSVGLAIEHLNERSQTFTKPELEVQAIKFAGVGLKDVGPIIDNLQNNNVLVEGGKTEKGVLILTTPGAKESERVFLGAIRGGFGSGSVILDKHSEFKSLLSEFESDKSSSIGKQFKLTDEQVVAAKNILMHKDVYQGVQGDAGTGKTASLEFVKFAAEKKGWVVNGVATTGFAARNLENDSGIKSQTVASFLHSQSSAVELKSREIERLKESIKNGSEATDFNGKAVERAKLSVKIAGTNFGSNVYSIDKQRGEVFKQENSFGNMLGGFFSDWAESRAGGISRDGATLKDKIVSQIDSRTTRLAQTLADRLTTYQKVGVLEAVGAREAYFRAKADPGDRLRARLAIAESELVNLRATGNREGRQTLLISDETGLMGIKDAEKFAVLTKAFGARAVLQGDIKQHDSVGAGAAFRQAQEIGMNVSKLTQTMRFNNATENTKSAIETMRTGRYGEALSKLDVTHVNKEKNTLADVVAQRFLANFTAIGLKDGRDLGNVGVVTNINADRKAINGAIVEILKTSGNLKGDFYSKMNLESVGETGAQGSLAKQLKVLGANAMVFERGDASLGIVRRELINIERFDSKNNLIFGVSESGKKVVFNPAKTSNTRAYLKEERTYYVGARVEARDNIKQRQSDKKEGFKILNATSGLITKLDKNGATIAWDGGKITELTNKQLAHVDLAYARTTFKEQGATRQRTIIAIGDVGASVFNKMAAYVASTRAKDNTEIVTTDLDKMLKNADKVSENTTALNAKNPGGNLSKVKKEEELWKAAMPSIQSNRQITVESTSVKEKAEGQDNSKRKIDRGNELGM